MITFAHIMEWLFTAAVGVMLLYVLGRWAGLFNGPKTDKIVKAAMKVEQRFRRHGRKAVAAAPPEQPQGNIYDPITDADWQWDENGVYEPFWDDVD